ncbi:MAG: glycosyltransferase [Verrucomicrobiota bacterium]|nr:glycosyltransferase [Verrucomicrobiota bacterium]
MRILILSSSTGGGHDMRARSLQQWVEVLKERYTQIEISRYQALEESSKIYALGVGIYNSIQKNLPALHHIYFNWLEFFQLSKFESLLLGKKNFHDALIQENPDLILSVHAHVNHGFRSYAKRILPQVKFVTYCGELHGGYGFSRHWVDPKADAFIGATKTICKAAIDLGMPKDRTLYGGFLLSPQFYKSVDSNQKKASTLRKALGFVEGPLTLLLSTGANGAQNHLKFIKSLASLQQSIQVIALCGHDTKAQEELGKLEQIYPQLTIRAFGKRSDMFELMQIADLIVARPGTGTTSEAIMAGCPMIMNTLGGVMPQEWITVKYVRAKGLSVKRLKKPHDLLEVIRDLTNDREPLEVWKQQMIALQPSLQPAEIINHLISIAGRTED